MYGMLCLSSAHQTILFTIPIHVTINQSKSKSNQIHPGIRIASHIVIIGVIMILMYQMDTLILFKHWKGELEGKLEMELYVRK